MQVKFIISDAYFFYLRNLRQIASLCLPFLILDAFFDFLFSSSQYFQSLYWVSYVAIYPIYTAALILLMAKSAKKEHPGNIELIAAAFKLWWPFYLLTVIQMALGAFGFILFIVPGIWIITRLSFAEFFLVLNGLNPLEAIRKSFETTKQYFWYILTFVVMAVACHGISDYLIGQAIQTVNDFTILYIAANTAISMIMLFFDVILFRMFMEAVVEQPAA